MTTRTRRESHGQPRGSITPTVAMRLLESSLVTVANLPGQERVSDASTCGSGQNQCQGQGQGTPDSSTSLSSPKSVLPALASLKIRCHQVVETETQPMQKALWVGPPLPCRVNGGCLWLEWKHFVDDVETIDFDSNELVLSSLLEPKQDSATGMQSSWEEYGISRFELSSQPGEQGAWIRFQSNALPPVGQHQARTELRWITLDICWSTRKMDCGQNGSRSPLERLGPDCLEFEAMSIAFKQIMRALAREHPLVFSPKDVDRFLHITRHNEILADSICQIYERSTHAVVQRKMHQSIKRMRMQYPCVPRNDVRTLLLHAFETVAYRLLNKSFKRRHASEAKSLTHTHDTSASLCQGRVLTEAAEGLDMAKDRDPDSESRFSDFFTFEQDSSLADSGSDQEFNTQSEIRRGAKRSRISANNENESFEPLSME